MKKASAFDMARHALENPESLDMSKVLYIEYPFYATIDDVSSDDDIRVNIEDRVTGTIYQYCSNDHRKCIQNATPEALIRRTARSIAHLRSQK